MALDAGSVTVDSEGAATGDGLAIAIFNGITSDLDADDKAAVAATLATFCEGLATAIVDHLTSNAEIEVTIETSDSGLQRTPNPNDPDTDTQGPSAQKTLAGTLA